MSEANDAAAPLFFERMERFYDLYKMDQNTSDYPKVGARVIANDGSNWFTSFTIDKGSKDGIEVDMNVIAGNGLVGIVTQVGPTWATVRSIIDDSMSAEWYCPHPINASSAEICR